MVESGKTLQDIHHDGRKPPRAARVVKDDSVGESVTTWWSLAMHCKKSIVVVETPLGQQRL